MGGHAFKYLHCPRIPPDVYNKVKSIATAALQTVFTHVTVPFEIPGKADYGDCDFLVSAPYGDASNLSHDTFPFDSVLNAIKHALATPHGRGGYLTRDCMYFAMPMPLGSTSHRLDDSEYENEEILSWVQIDAKICFEPEAFSWLTFELNYATQSGILGRMIKPLGLTMNQEGLHIRVEEMESTDWAGSLVRITRDPWMTCRVLGLSRRAVDGGFSNGDEIYTEYAGSWLFHPETFKISSKGYLEQHAHRSHFLEKWIPERYPDYKPMKVESEQADLVTWTTRTRAAVSKKVFTMFPDVAKGYYVKRSQHVQREEEHRLRDLITAAIPAGTEGWRNDFDLPNILFRQLTTQDSPSTPLLQPVVMQQHELTPPSAPSSKLTHSANVLLSIVVSPSDPLETPLYINTLPHQTPHSCKPSPPPETMSAAARLACLARWTFFSARGTPCLLTTPHTKDFDLQWRDAIAAGCREEELKEWAMAMWWVVWIRQCVVNWRDMWAERFEKKDAKAKKARGGGSEQKAEMDAIVKGEVPVRFHKEKMLGRLEGLNRALGFNYGPFSEKD